MRSDKCSCDKFTQPIQQHLLARDNEHCKLRESRHTCQHKIPSRCFWRFASFCILSWLSAVVQLHHWYIYMYQHIFSWLFQYIQTFFRVVNYKLRLFTPRSSYGAKEMAPKSQLCACSFQDSLRQKSWAPEQIRKFPDTIRYVWTAENNSNMPRVDVKIFASAKKYLRKKKFPDTCRHGLRKVLHTFHLLDSVLSSG